MIRVDDALIVDGRLRVTNAMVCGADAEVSRASPECGTYADTMCACTDAACADAVAERYDALFDDVPEDEHVHAHLMRAGSCYMRLRAPD